MAIARHKTRQRELREARALLRRVQRGDRRAFELLYAAYEGRLYRFCHRLTGRSETAAALVELTFARALRDLPDRGLDTLDVPAYLYATARALAFERGGAIVGSRGAAESEVGAANERLAPQERALLALRDLEARPDAEIAGALGVDEAVVPGLVGAARLRLLAELRPPGVVEVHPDRLPDLSAYADATLPAERRSELEKHVAECAHCRAVVFALREASLRYAGMPLPEPPGDLGSRIAAALGAVGLPASGSAAAEPPAAGGRQTAAAVAMGALAIVGVGVTIAASHDHGDGSRPASRPAPAPAPASPPAAQRSAAASASPLAVGAVALAPVTPRRPPPVLHHLRTGPRRRVAARPPRTPPPNPILAELGKSYAPESPPVAPAPPPAASAPVTTPKPKREIPVQVVPPAAPPTSHAQPASEGPAPEPKPQTQTTST